MRKPLFAGGARRFAERESYGLRSTGTLAFRRMYGRGSLGAQEGTLGTKMGEAAGALEPSEPSSFFGFRAPDDRCRVSFRKHGVPRCQFDTAFLARHSYSRWALEARRVEGRLQNRVRGFLDCRRTRLPDGQFQHPPGCTS